MMACPYCGKECPTLSSFIRHIRATHLSGNTCPTCGLSYRSLAGHAALIYRLYRDPEHAALLLATSTRHNGLRKQAIQTIKNPPKTTTIYPAQLEK